MHDIDRIVNDALQIFHVPGAAISIVLNDEILISRGYGFRNLAEQLPVTEHTLFPIGSCTKAFTALILGQLVDEGRITFDDPVQKYIPELYLGDQERTAKLTIRDLLAHRTGIARHDPIWFFSDIVSRLSVINMVKNFEPACGLRQEFQYNNFMYTLAAIISERILEQSWEEIMASRLLQRLHMENSNITVHELQKCSDFSLPYAERNGVITKIPFRSLGAVSPGGGINSNALEMANWLKLQLNGNDFIIRKRTLDEMHSLQMPFAAVPSENEPVYCHGYGLGWFLGKYRKYNFISHAGDIDGFSSEVAFLPERGLGIVILTNSSSDGRYVISSIRNQIFDKFLDMKDIDWASKLQEIHATAKNALQSTIEIFETRGYSNSMHSVDSYIGNYLHPAYGKMEIKVEDNYLMASIGKVSMPLYCTSKDIFTARFMDLLNYGMMPFIDFKFFKDSSNKIYKVEVPFEGFRGAKPIVFIREL
jgi:CubicO group peptidase (beta-lactamase class C family)